LTVADWFEEIKKTIRLLEKTGQIQIYLNMLVVYFRKAFCSP
jgi:hypothetical protein